MAKTRKGRPVVYDQDKVKELRMEIVMASLAIMKGEDDASKWSQYKRELVLKYAPRVLPTLVAGRSDDEKLLNLEGVEISIRKNE